MSVYYTLPHNSKTSRLPASVLSFPVNGHTKTPIKKVSSLANDSKVRVMQNASIIESSLHESSQHPFIS